MQHAPASPPSRRILLAAPDERLIRAFAGMSPAERHDILALNVLDQPTDTVIASARASSIDVMISRGGMAESLRAAQKADPDPIPVVEIHPSPFDIMDAVAAARKISSAIACIAYANVLEGIRKIADLFRLDIRFVRRSSPWDCLEAVFNALEHGARVIIGDARVASVCEKNNIPCVPLTSGADSLRLACRMARNLVEARDAARNEARRLATILDCLDVAVLALDGERRVLYGNAAASALADMEGTRLHGMDIREVPFFRKHCPAAFFREDAESVVSIRGETAPRSLRWRSLEETAGGAAGVLSCRSLEEPSAGLLPVGNTGGAERESPRFSFASIVGTSAALRAVKARARRYAATDATVLLLGETGVGKELFARAIHAESPRSGEPFVAVNLAALPSTLMESELFGYVRGAFTDARRRGRQGVFEFAGRGTVFLDEIGEIPPEMQAKLLRVLQDGEFMRLGDDQVLTARCRIVAATNCRLEDAVRGGTFRADLYYRLNILSLRIPPLAARGEDVGALAGHFLKTLCARYGKRAGTLSPAALRRLRAYPWKGNARELQAVMERYVILHDGPLVSVEADALDSVLEAEERPPAERGRHTPDSGAIAQALRESGGRISVAARALGIHRTTLWRLLKTGAAAP